MSFLNFLLNIFSVNQFSYAQMSAFTDYDEDGYPVDDEWDDDEDDDEDYDEENDYELDNQEETEWK